MASASFRMGIPERKRSPINAFTSKIGRAVKRAKELLVESLDYYLFYLSVEGLDRLGKVTLKEHLKRTAEDIGRLEFVLRAVEYFTVRGFSEGWAKDVLSHALLKKMEHAFEGLEKGDLYGFYSQPSIEVFVKRGGRLPAYAHQTLTQGVTALRIEGKIDYPTAEEIINLLDYAYFGTRNPSKP